MEEKAFYTLKIDPAFRCLIRPLYKREYKKLESSILEQGCLFPILTWSGYIIDGHNRYNICREHNIPFSVEKAEFDNRESVIAWICVRQLARRDIPEEQRRYLIGMQYETEKIANSQKNHSGKNQHNRSNKNYELPYDDFDLDFGRTPSGHITALRIGEENHVSWNTVYKYSIYARAIEVIRKKVPSMAVQILSGRYKISHNNLVELSKMKAEQIKKVAERFEYDRMNCVHFKNARQEIRDTIDRSVQYQENPPNAPSVKDVPSFDPDAEITSLSLTVPSWTGSMERVLNKTDFEITSETARTKLIDALYNLMRVIKEMLSVLKED